MYHPTTRVLTVLELLQSHGQMSGRELAMRLDVDGRTVRRYITMLQDMGIPIEGERGRYGAYRLRPGYRLPPLMFSEDETLVLVLGLLAAQRLGLGGAAPATQGALAKVERVLPAHLRQQVQAVERAVAIAAPPAHDYDPTILLTLCLAVQQRQRTQLRYRAYNDNLTVREIEPYGLVYYTGIWYTAGYCHLRGDLRTFRLDRIQAAQLADGTFSRPADFDVADYVARSLANIPNRWAVEVHLYTTLDEARWEIPAWVATLELVENSVKMRCTVDNLDWMARYLVGCGLRFSVVQPPELRVALRRLGEELATV